MRDRLIETIHDYFGVDAMYFGVDAADLANHLLANGVIVPPVRVGQTVYIIDDEVECGDEYVLDVTVDEVGRDRGGVWVTLNLPLGFNRSAYVGAFEIGKTVFLTKEEAEKALKESEKV